MSIKSREIVAPQTVRRATRHQPERKPPTQSQLSIAAYRLADELGGRECDQQTRDDAAAQIYDFASKSVATAWSLYDSAIIAVRCYSGRRKVSGARGEVVDPFMDELDKAKAEDLRAKGELIEEIKDEGTSAERKAEIESELGELLLRGAPQGREYKIGSAAMEFLQDAMIGEFMPVVGSPMAEQDFPRFVGSNVRFLDWLGTTLLFTEEQKAEYARAKDADKAARAEAGSESAPAEEDEGEETEAPDEEPAAQSA